MGRRILGSPTTHGARAAVGALVAALTRCGWVLPFELTASRVEYTQVYTWGVSSCLHRPAQLCFSHTLLLARAATKMRCSGWSLGVLLIVIVAFIWNAASVLVQYIFTDYTFFRPFFLTYLANSLFVVTLPLRSLTQLVRRRSSSPTEAQGDGSADSLRVTARAALVVCPLWFLANFRRAAPPLHRRCTAAAPPLHRHTDTARHRERCRMAVTTGAWA